MIGRLVSDATTNLHDAIVSPSPDPNNQIRDWNKFHASIDEWKKERQEIFNRIVSEAGWLTRGMLPRITSKNQNLERFGIRVLLYATREYTFFVAVLGYLVLVFSSIQFNSTNTKFYFSILFGWLIASINWSIGTYWLNAIGDLDFDHSYRRSIITETVTGNIFIPASSPDTNWPTIFNLPSILFFTLPIVAIAILVLPFIGGYFVLSKLYRKSIDRE